MNIQAWIEANIPGDEMYWRGAFGQQARFLRDDLPHALGMTYDDVTKHNRVTVISQHTSKSIRLPVVQYAMNDAKLVVRGNFHDFKISVDSDKDLTIDPRGLFDPGTAWSSCYCEGFPEDMVFGSYAKSRRRFTVEVGYSFAAWAFAREVRLALAGPIA